ncbi:type I restriction-modification system subunit M [Candidatus Cryosericum septentrionale]|jgi:type I restriction enzyme M protein|uniref:site-specific DNA-methyltransferase (adenine-specific) n=1 Tax=Candidatus Cryosericum septentrionale TaxID=2290913 RepID=A0A398DQ92_9BACT|nr:class I SAM-dependent DNA methyltransferase [Candidatus Cryosericum septentrionale]RIE17395.1 SAM-dependent DNA methyltransferase [Candidatus Cryosericum septentrionale]
MTSDEGIAVVGRNIQEKAALIWNVANTLYGAYKPHEYGLVILPMVVIKRFHDCLLPTHQAVLDKYAEIEDLAVKDGFLRSASGYQFYNTSPFTFDTLKADSANIEDNFRAYIAGFSDNVQDILGRMNFSAQIERMVEAKVLYQVVTDFCSDKANMSPDRIRAIDMGYIFENLVQRFSESYDEEAGAHFTSRDIIYLMCDLLVANDRHAFMDSDGITKTVYDMAMGTSQMLTCLEERLKQLDADADVTCFGQEFNAFTFGIAKADMLIRGGDPDNMQFGDTLNDDKFNGYQFDYCISNPPFGIDWKREAAAVEAEHKKGPSGRFGPGLPAKSDGQMLFMLNGIAKLKQGGRMSIIQNGSSLSTGDAESGPSEIRRYLIENDWLDAIVQLPNDSFYNTGIATYVWIITKGKPNDRVGKVQLIDASACYENRRKPIGNKRVDITETARDLIVQVYGDYRDGAFEAKTQDGKTVVCKSKMLDAVSFGYNQITVESPLLNEHGKNVLKNGKPATDSQKRDTENVPLDEDIDAYFEREVLPYNPGSWIDRNKTKVGYEIPFTRTFYEYKQLEPAGVIAKRIEEHERVLIEKLHALFGKDHE